MRIRGKLAQKEGAQNRGRAWKLMGWGGGRGQSDKADENGFERRNMSSTHLYFFWYLAEDNFSYMSDLYFAKFFFG